MKNLFFTLIMLLTTLFGQAQGIIGSWKGDIQAGGIKLPLVFHIRQEGENYSATLDSPLQKATGIVVDKSEYTAPLLTLTISKLGASYQGELKGDSIIGVFRQSGLEMPLVLRKSDANNALNRPQEPKAPFSYKTEDVVFINEVSGNKLAGTLTLPETGSDFPVAILISGSGPQNRDEEILAHRPFLVLADYLTRNGIAVLRYDDRGVGQSEGNYKTASLCDFTSDGVAALNYMKTRKEINPKRIGIIGHSEGGTIGFKIAASNASDVAYVVSMAGMAIPGDSLLIEQRYMLGKASGLSDAMIAQNEQMIKMTENIIRKYSADSITNHFDAIAATELPEPLKQNPAVIGAIKKGVIQMISPEIQSLLTYNPTEALAKISCPVLALNGAKDLQVGADRNLSRIRSLVKAPVTLRKFENLNHLFQNCKTGLPNEYGQIEETLSPDVLLEIKNWITTTLNQ